MNNPEKKYVQRKIRELVYLHGVHVKNLTGIEINQEVEYKRLHAEWQAGFINLTEIIQDIDQYLGMRKQNYE
jgi:hypothetical protein